MNKSIACAATLLFAGLLQLSGRCESAPEPSGWLIGVGYVQAPNPYAAGISDVDGVLPLVGYLGDRLRWLGPRLTYEFVDRDEARIAALAQVRFQSIDDEALAPAFDTLQPRDPALEAGMELELGPLFAAFRTDVSGRHDGYELSLAVHETWNLSDRWTFDGRIGLTWQSSDLTRYLYGVDAEEATSLLRPYAPGGALNYRASLDVTHPLTNRWFAFASVGVDFLDDEISSSPIVVDDRQAGAFLGVVYRLGRFGRSR